MGTSLKERLCIYRPCALLCLLLISVAVYALIVTTGLSCTYNRPEIALRLTLYFYVYLTRNVFSQLIIVLLCGKVISIESD